jgi:hypothetical protein
MTYSEFKKNAGEIIDKLGLDPNSTDPADIDKVLAATPFRTNKLYANMARVKPQQQAQYATVAFPLAIGLQQFINGGPMTGKAIMSNPNIQKGLATGTGAYVKELLYPRKLIAWWNAGK